MTDGIFTFGRYCAALTGLLLLLGCGEPRPRWNVLLVTFDTTRADRLGCYGDAQARTPVVDALAAEGVLFENALAHAPITLPSHSSLLTGKVPFVHGVRDNGLFVLGEEQVTLAEVLRDHGYRTGAAIASYPLLEQFGTNQGFEFYDDEIATDYEDLFGDRIFPKARLYFDERPASQVNGALMPWLEEHHDQPFFAWLHYFDPHQPTEPPPPYDQLFAHDPYRGEIAYADESLGVFLEHLRRLGVLENTLVIMTADHGEGLDEHNESTHSMLLYQTTQHVPLVMKLPQGIAGRRVAQRVGLVDVMPTVLDLLGIEAPSGIQGRSLAGYLTDETPPPRDRQRELYAETLSPRLARDWGELRALVVDDYKYVHGPILELYALAEDPRELNNLVTAEPERAEGLRSRLERYLAEHAVEGLDASAVLDEEAAQRLQALGYLQTGGMRAVGPQTEELRTDGDPPQKHSLTNTTFSRAKSEMYAGRLVEAKELILDLLEADPTNPNYLEMLLGTELRLGRPQAALELLGQLEALEAPFPPPQKVQELAGLILLQLGRKSEGLARLQRAHEIEPTADRAYMLALLYADRKDSGAHRQALEEALELDPGMAPARIDLAITYAQEGNSEAATAEFRKAATDRPYDPRAQYNLGLLLLSQGDREAAIAQFRRAAEVGPRYLRAHYALFELLYEDGDWGAATESFDLLHRLAPNSREARQARLLMGIEE